MNKLNFIQILYDLDCSIIQSDEELYSLIQTAYTAIRICVPILTIILISLDMLSAVVSSDDKNMKEAQNRSIKRLIIGVVIFFIPTVLNIIFNLAGNMLGTCGIG